MAQSKGSSRRTFIRNAAAAGVGAGMAPGIARAQGVNDRIRVGFIGVGNRGSQLLDIFMKQRDVDIAALCDVYEPYINRDRNAVLPRWKDELGGRVPPMGESFGAGLKRMTDFRQVLDDPDIDAVVIATPDHWHAVQAIMAMEAGKDVYVEKPLTITIHEGRRIVDAAERTGRIVQVGLNRRGSAVYRKTAEMVQDGRIGNPLVGRAFRISNMFPDGIGNAETEQPPPGFDWDMWLGPRAERPFQANIHPYRFRWWSDFSSQMGNWGVHYMDAIRWMMGETAPAAITATGGKYVLNDDRTIPDTMEVTFEFSSGKAVNFSIYEACGGHGVPDGEVEIRGTKATIAVSERGYKIKPSSDGQFQDWEQLVDEDSMRLENRDNSTANLIRDFLDCVKSRGNVLCPPEEGHRSTSFAHLANIALASGGRIEWDADAERITNNDGANNLLHYEYREPWTLG